MRSALLARLRRRKGKEISFDTWNSSGKGDGIAPQVNGVRYFSFEELQSYTDNFSESNLIGQGGYGKVYTGYPPNGVIVAIKRADEYSNRGVQEFKNEIELLSRVHHKNIVTLVGFCFEQGEQLLVYEYISKSLDTILYDKNNILEWKQRLQIALDLARALAYLHELVNPQIIHGDPKPSKVLLDENLNAKLIDFGMSELSHGKKEVEPERISGTMGYIDPVFAMTGKLSEKSDVYTFGVVMLELLTGRPCFRFKAEDQPTFLVEEVKIAIVQDDQEYYGLRDLVDPKIINHVKNSTGFRNFVQLALACISELPLERPSMYEVMKQIEVILQNY